MRHLLACSLRRQSALCLLLTLFTGIAGIPAASAQSNESLGRLFLSPERRANLDRQRQLNQTQSRETLSENASLTLNGVVRRSSGRNTAWINGNAVDEKSAGNNVRFPPRAQAPIDSVGITAAGSSQALRVGESVNHESGERETALRGGSISVHRNPPGKK